MDTLAKRLRAAMDLTEDLRTQYALSGRSGVQQTTIKRILDGKSLEPKEKNLRPLAYTLKVRYLWLRDGTEPMRGDDADQVSIPSPSINIAALHALQGVATPRSLAILDRIEKALIEGRISEADIALLEQIAERFSRQPSAAKAMATPKDYSALQKEIDEQS